MKKISLKELVEIEKMLEGTGLSLEALNEEMKELKKLAERIVEIQNEKNNKTAELKKLRDELDNVQLNKINDWDSKELSKRAFIISSILCDIQKRKEEIETLEKELEQVNENSLGVAYATGGIFTPKSNADKMKPFSKAVSKGYTKGGILEFRPEDMKLHKVAKALNVEDYNVDKVEFDLIASRIKKTLETNLDIRFEAMTNNDNVLLILVVIYDTESNVEKYELEYSTLIDMIMDDFKRILEIE